MINENGTSGLCFLGAGMLRSFACCDELDMHSRAIRIVSALRMADFSSLLQQETGIEGWREDSIARAMKWDIRLQKLALIFHF